MLGLEMLCRWWLLLLVMLLLLQLACVLRAWLMLHGQSQAAG
jgi:hypothetical protein